MSVFNRILLDHQLSEWADEHTLMAARRLNRVAGELIDTFEAEAAQASLMQSFVTPDTFIRERIVPLLQARAAPVVAEIVGDANAALVALVGREANWAATDANDQDIPQVAGAGQDIAVAALPMAAGLATAAAVPLLAVSTTTAWFGLVTATVISWPVVLGGGVLAGAGVLTGAINSARLKEKAGKRLHDQIRQFILSFLITGTHEQPAILERLAGEFAQVASLGARQEHAA